jgi:transcriptional regulator with XRE-family HTH domain
MVNAQQIRAARAWLGMSQDDLAVASLVSKRTIAGIELGQSSSERTLRDIQQALEVRGIEFLFDHGVAAGVKGPL